MQTNNYLPIQVTHKCNEKVSRTDYPKIAGLAKDWIMFAYKFVSVVSSQGLEYVLQADESQQLKE